MLSPVNHHSKESMWLPFPVNVFMMIWNGRAKPRPHRYAPKNLPHRLLYSNSNTEAIDFSFLFFDFCYNLNGALDHGCPIIFYSSSCTRLASMSFVKKQVCTILYLKNIVTAILFNLSEVFVAISARLYFLFVVFSLSLQELLILDVMQHFWCSLVEKKCWSVCRWRK